MKFLPELNLNSVNLPNLERLLYGFATSADYFGQTIKYHHISTLVMIIATAEAKLFVNYGTEKPTACVKPTSMTYYMQVTRNTSRYVKKIEKKFQCKEPVWNNTCIVELKIDSGNS